MQCSMNGKCCRLFSILVGFICDYGCVFGSILAVCFVCLFCNVGLCCKCCFYLLSVTIVVFFTLSINVTFFKDVSKQLFHYCERSITNSYEYEISY